VVYALAVTREEVGVRVAVVQRLDPLDRPVVEARDDLLHAHGDGPAAIRHARQFVLSRVADGSHAERAPRRRRRGGIPHDPAEMGDVPVDRGIGCGAGRGGLAASPTAEQRSGADEGERRAR
jgi:hypothetical protein